MPQPLDWQPLSPFGAVVDLDLSGHIPDDTVDELRDLYERRHLLLFREQQLSEALQARVTGWFGPVLPEQSESYISTDPNVGGLGTTRLVFHSDLVCSPHPLLGLSLHAVDVVDGGTSTVFVDAVGAAAVLPESLRERIEGNHGKHLWPTSVSERQRADTVSPDWPGSVHPLLMPHPRTGELILLLNENHTDRIVELDPEESELLIQELFARLYAAENSYEHRWHNGDFIVWDNLALQHGRPAVQGGGTRTLQRVALGTHGYMELMPPELLDAYMSG